MTWIELLVLGAFVLLIVAVVLFLQNHAMIKLMEGAMRLKESLEDEEFVHIVAEYSGLANTSDPDETELADFRKRYSHDPLLQSAFRGAHIAREAFGEDR